MADQVLDDLIAARALIDTPEKWQKHRYHSDDGNRHCSMGAVFCVTTDYRREEACRLALARAVPASSPHFSIGTPYHFNDAPETTHADIMAMYDRAIATRKGAQPDGER